MKHPPFDACSDADPARPWLEHKRRGYGIIELKPIESPPMGTLGAGCRFFRQCGGDSCERCPEIGRGA